MKICYRGQQVFLKSAESQRKNKTAKRRSKFSQGTRYLPLTDILPLRLSLLLDILFDHFQVCSTRTAQVITVCPKGISPQIFFKLLLIFLTHLSCTDPFHQSDISCQLLIRRQTKQQVQVIFSRGKKNQLMEEDPFVYEQKLEKRIRQTKARIAQIGDKILRTDEKAGRIPSRITFGSKKQYKKKDTLSLTGKELEAWHQERELLRSCCFSRWELPL